MKLFSAKRKQSDLMTALHLSMHSRASGKGEKTGRMLLVVAGVGIASLIVWASLAHIDELARARGQVISVARTQVIQSADGGVLDELLVQEGGRVVKGQVLARLDRSRAQAAVEDSQAKVAALRAALVRLKAEVFGHTPAFGNEFADWPAFISNQQALFERRQRAQRESVSALREVLANVQKELAITEPLEAAGDVGRAEVLRLKRQVAELQGQIINLQNKYFQDAQSDMTKAEEDLATQEQSLAERTTLLEHTDLHAPMNGIVKRILITTIGAALRPSDTLMELVPADGEFIVEAKFSPTDVAFLRPGLPVSVKLDAYDYSIYGKAWGEVIYISPDALSEPDPRQGEHIYYRVHVRIDLLPDMQVRGKPMVLQPGMTVQVEVKTGERSVLKYLAKPLVKTLSESMTER